MTHASDFLPARSLVLGLTAVFFTLSAHAQAVREIPLPNGRGYSGIAVAADGTAYIAEYEKSAIAIVRPDKSVVEARTITGSSSPIGVRMGADGNVWFVEADAMNIGVMQPDGTMLNEYATRCRPTGQLAAGSGNALWFSESCATSGTITGEFITRINTAGTMSQFRIGTVAGPARGLDGLVEGPDGDIWFVEQFGKAGIGRLDPKTGRYAEFLLPAPSFVPLNIYLGPDGNFWIPALGDHAMLDRLDSRGVFTQFDWGGEELVTMGIGPDNSFWGIDDEKAVWRIDVGTSTITKTAIPSKLDIHLQASYMTSDQNHNLWFSEYKGCALGRIDMDALFNDDFDACP